jgi:hypothetical protein
MLSPWHSKQGDKPVSLEYRDDGFATTPETVGHILGLSRADQSFVFRMPLTYTCNAFETECRAHRSPPLRGGRPRRSRGLHFFIYPKESYS